MVAAGVLSALVATPALGRLWGSEPGASGRLVYLDRIRGKNGGLAKPFLTLSPLFWWHCLGRDLKSKSIKWAKSAFQTPGAFLAFKVTLGRQEGASCRAVSAAVAWWVAA